MNIKYLQKFDQEPITTSELHYLNILVDGKDQQGRFPQTVCTIEVTSPSNNSLSARFFVEVGIDSNGKPFANLTGLKKTTDTRKTVFASWLDFAQRAAVAIASIK